MAQVSIIVNAFVLAFVAAIFASTVSAQELAPAPAPDAGAAFSLPVSGVMIGTSILFSLYGLLRH